jgi:hypothetical protein
MKARKRPAPTDRPSPNNTECVESTAYVCQIRARQAAARRLPILESGRSDPWHYEPSEAGYEPAAQHLLELGLPPAPNSEALQAMRRRGGHSLRAAEIITEVWGGAA